MRQIFRWATMALSAAVLSTVVAIPRALDAQDGAVASASQNAPVELAHYTPQSALLVASVPSVTRLGEALKSHPLWRLYDEEEMQTFLKPAMGAIRGGVQVAEEFTGLTLEEMIKLIGGRIDFALHGVVEGAFGPRPTLALAIEMTDRAKAARLVDTLVNFGADEGQEIEPCKIGGIDGFRTPVPFDVYFALVRGSLVVSTDEALMTKIAKGETLPQGERISANAGYRASLTRVEGGASHAFVAANVKAILKTVIGQVREEQAEEVTTVLRMLGFDAVSWVVDSVRFTEHGVREFFHVRTGSPRRGLVAVIDSMKPGVSLAKDMPGNSAFFYGAHFDPAQMYDTIAKTIRDAAAEIQEPELVQIVSALSEAESGSLGFKLREELIPALGEEVGVSLGLPLGSTVPAFLVRIKLKDPAKISSILETLREQVPADVVSIIKRKVSGTPLYVIRPKKRIPVNPVISIVGDQLVVAANVSLVRKVIKGQMPSVLADEASYKGALASLGQYASKGATQMFIDLKRALSYGYDMASPFLSSLEPDDLDVPIDLALMPTTETFVRHMTHVASTDIIDADGYTIVADSPIPLSLLQFGMFAGFAVVAPRRSVAAEARPTMQPPVSAPVARAAPMPAPKPSGPRLGIEVDDLPDGRGCKVAVVPAGGSAAKAGLRVGDVIIGVDGKKAPNADAVAEALKKKKAGDRLALQLRRKDGETVVELVINVILQGK